MMSINAVNAFYVYRHESIIKNMKRRINFNIFSKDDFDKYYAFFMIFLMYEKYDNTRWVSQERIDEFLELSGDEKKIIEKYTLGESILDEYQQNVYKMNLIKNEFINQYLEMKNEYEIKKEYNII